jgi:hypothetical protein
MKTKTACCRPHFFLGVLLLAFRVSTSYRAFCADTPPPAVTSSAYVSDSGPHFRQWTITTTNAPDAQSAAASTDVSGGEQAPVVRQQRVMEIGTGMQYWNGQQWADSDPTLSVSPEGDAFISQKLHYNVRLQADNLNNVGAITVTTPDGILLKSTPVAIGLYDAQSGQSTILAGITNSAGMMIDSNQVLYEDAFNENGVKASVLCTTERGSLAVDIILTSNLIPEDYGFPAQTTRLQIFTEYYDAPQPDRIRTALRVETDEQKRLSMASPDLIDETLGFGEFTSGRGRVYTMTSSTNATSAVVAKEFTTVNERTFLI